jgi:hypothetical protein
MSTGLEAVGSLPLQHHWPASAKPKVLMHGDTGLFRHHVNTTVDASSTASPNASSRPRHLFTAGRQTESKGKGLQGQRVASLCTLQDIMRGLQSQDKTRGTRTRLRQRWTRTRINERDTRREPLESRGTSRDRTEGQLASRIYTIKRTGLDFTPSTGLDKAVPSCGRQH